MSTDDSICESSLPPNKSSGDIGEKASQFIDGIAPYTMIRFDSRSGTTEFTEHEDHMTVRVYTKTQLMAAVKSAASASAAEIERLRRELEQERATFARHEQTLRDNGIASHAEAVVRVHAAESAVAAAWEEAAKIADGHADAILKRAQAHPTEGFVNGMLGANASMVRSIASAIRAAVSKKTAESGHSPSTHNSESE